MPIILRSQSTKGPNLYVLFITILVFALFSYLFIKYADSLKAYHRGNCLQLMAQVRQPEKIEYLKLWVEDKILSEKFKRYVYRGENNIYAEDLSGKNVSIELPDWERMPGYEYMRKVILIQADTEGVGYISKENITQITYGNELYAIILSMGAEGVNNYRGRGMESGKLLRVREGVFLYCRHMDFNKLGSQ